MNWLKPILITQLFVTLLATMISTSVIARDELPPISTDARFSGFNTKDYILESHPTLAKQAETTSHWAGYFSINPILFAYSIKARYGNTVPAGSDIKLLARAMNRIGSSSLETGKLKTDSRQKLETSLADTINITMNSSSILIDQTTRDMAAAGISYPMAVSSDNPPALDLPFAAPQVWQFNGAHTWTGDDDGTPMSSLDFTRTWGLNLGDSTDSDLVTASHDGEVAVYSSCFVQIQHDNGWSTRYYHLDNLQVIQGQRVLAGDILGNYASDQDQALCSGGSSTGPHVHFALLKDGQYFSLQDVELSGYRVHPGTSSYDSARTRMWLEKRATQYYAFNVSIGIEDGDNTIDYRYNGMWYSPDNNGHGVNVEITEFPTAEGSRNAVFIVFYTYDDSGLANFYVGNIDFARWRIDETLVIDMLQTSGGDLTNLFPIDFNNPDDVKPAGQAEVGFLDCNNAIAHLSLVERSAQQPTEHSIEMVKLIGVPEHVCEAASMPLPK
jgi:hypothetical protein